MCPESPQVDVDQNQEAKIMKITKLEPLEEDMFKKEAMTPIKEHKPAHQENTGSLASDLLEIKEEMNRLKQENAELAKRVEHLMKIQDPSPLNLTNPVSITIKKPINFRSNNFKLGKTIKREKTDKSQISSIAQNRGDRESSLSRRDYCNSLKDF